MAGGGGGGLGVGKWMRENWGKEEDELQRMGFDLGNFEFKCLNL